MHIIIGMPPAIIMTGAPMAIIEVIASQRSFIFDIIEGSIGIIFIIMPSFVISQDILHIMGITPAPMGIIIGIIMPFIIGIGMPPIMPFIIGIGIGMPPIIPFIIGIMPPMPFIIGMLFIGMLFMGIPIIEPFIIGMAFMESSSIEPFG
jgi:hypothetical protein